MSDNYHDSESGGSHPMDFLLTQELNLPAVGEIRRGQVVQHSENFILIDLGGKSEGIIIGEELTALDEETLEQLEVGADVRVYVMDVEDSNGNIVLSYRKAAEENDWEDAANLLKSQDIYKTKIIGFNRGGVLAKVGHIRGFIPNSQLSRENQAKNKEDFDKHFQTLIGRPVTTKVIEVDRKRNRLILSERAARQEIREAKREALLKDLNIGDVCEGKVVNLADFGAFVDIGGIEGLVHLSELSWKRTNDPSEVIQVGDKVKVSILKIDEDQKRLALSIKRLQPDPWSLLEDHYHVGQLVEVTITKITRFGAFARLNDDYELVGLIHISELSENHIDNPHDIVKPSQKVMVRIIRIDTEQRQLGLSLKQVSSDRFIEADMEMLSSSSS
ncbi:MAG: S1 RNA-binding domain-containing protein [Anaerolineae bacterium]